MLATKFAPSKKWKGKTESEARKEGKEEKRRKRKFEKSRQPLQCILQCRRVITSMFCYQSNEKSCHYGFIAYFDPRMITFTQSKLFLN